MIAQETYRAHLWELLSPVRPLLECDDVSEVMINGAGQIFTERRGRLLRERACFDDDLALMAALRLISQVSGRNLSEEAPILEARLPDGSRLEAVIPPAAPGGPHVAIRRFHRETLTLDRLIRLGSLDKNTAGLLASLVAAKRNIVVAGGTGTGKTSMLNVLSSFVDPGERVVVIEDARELQLQGDHVVHFEAQPAAPSGRGAVSVRDLLRATLRMRPDRIVVGEVRDGAALEMVQAMITGHAGCLSTVHASHPIDALHRVETLALMSDVRLPLTALRTQIASALDILVQVTRWRDGRRAVESISEVRGVGTSGDYVVADLVRREGEGGHLAFAEGTPDNMAPDPTGKQHGK